MSQKIYRYCIVAIVLLTGCSKVATLKIYTLETPVVSPLKKRSYSNKILKVTYPKSLKESISSQMYFSYNNEDRGVYQNAQWSNNINTLLQGTLIEVLEESKRFKAVLFDSSSANEAYRLESTIFAFEHRIRNTKSYAYISLQCTLIDVSMGNIVKTKRFTYKEATQTTDAKGYVEATNRALAHFAHDLLVWL